MRNKIPIIAVLLLFTAMTACSGVSGKLQESSAQPPNRSSKSAIRQADFKNFSYPKLPTGKCSLEEIHMKDGKYKAPEEWAPDRTSSVGCWAVTLDQVDYGDVTGDGIEEAIVTLYAEMGGTESSQDVYIYTSQGGEPVLLWKFATGDRADGGRRRIAAENGALVIELFGVGTMIGKDLYDTEDVPDCCPEHYTRTKYNWQEDRFQQEGPQDVLPNPSGNAIPVSVPSPT